MMANRHIILSFILLFLSAVGSAQETAVSPYSMFGIGDLQLGESGRTAGMGATGTGLSGGRFLNTTNPASLAYLDSLTFLFDIAGSVRGASFTSGNKTQNAFGGSFTKISFGTHVSKFWSSAIVLQPYSVVNYKVEREGYIEGSNIKTSTLFEGSGGMTRFSFLNSFRLTKNFSVGADAMLLFGSIEKKTSQSSFEILQRSSATTASFNLGVMYSGKISPKLILGLGAIYGHGGNLNFSNSLEVTGESSTPLFTDDMKSSQFTLPRSYGGGVSLIGHRLIFNADYRFQQWSVAKESVSRLTFTDTHKVDAGFAFTPAKGTIKSYLEIIQYQAGFSVSNSYFSLNDVNPLNYEVSVGAALPFRSGTQLTLAFSGGQRGSLREGLILEKYVRMTISLSIAETWFLKRLWD